MKNKSIPNLDYFRNEVYRGIRNLEMLDETRNMENLPEKNTGCLNAFFVTLIKTFLPLAQKKQREHSKIDELNIKADIILADKEIMQEVCLKLDKFEHIYIDVAYKITPVLYEKAIENQAKIPLDSMLFAVIVKKIVDKGVVNFCE